RMINDYFQTLSTKKPSTTTSTTNATTATTKAKGSDGGADGVVGLGVDVPPLMLQHEGHSRTIMGIEKRKDGSYHLLILGMSPHDKAPLFRSLLTIYANQTQQIVTIEFKTH